MSNLQKTFANVTIVLAVALVVGSFIYAVIQ